MVAFSRRQLAKYAVEQLVTGKKPADIANRLAASLIASKRQNQADLLLADISEQLEARGILAEATVTTLNGLSSGLRSQLSSQIQKAAKVDNVIINEQTDPAIIGGFRVETARRTWDKTLARKLSQIKGGI